MQTILVTEGAGFIGANFVLQARKVQWANVVDLDKLTYASNLQTLAELQNDQNYHFIQGDIGNVELVSYFLEQLSVLMLAGIRWHQEYCLYRARPTQPAKYLR